MLVASAALLGVLGCGGEEARDAPVRPAPSATAVAGETPMKVALARPGRGPALDVLTVEGGCRVATRARVLETSSSVTVRVFGSDEGTEVCTAEIKFRCVQVSLDALIGDREIVLSDPASEADRSRAPQLLAAARRNTGCRPIPTG